MYCNNCGNKVNENDVFCGECGARVNGDDIKSNVDEESLNDEELNKGIEEDVELNVSKKEVEKDYTKEDLSNEAKKDNSDKSLEEIFKANFQGDNKKGFSKEKEISTSSYDENLENTKNFQENDDVQNSKDKKSVDDIVKNINKKREKDFDRDNKTYNKSQYSKKEDYREDFRTNNDYRESFNKNHEKNDSAFENIDDNINSFRGKFNNYLNIKQAPGKFNWGAFMLTIPWGLGNGCYIVLLQFVPIFGIIMSFVAGFKGNEWAINSGNYRDMEEFSKVQETWNKAGFISFVISLVIFLIFLVLGIIPFIIAVILAPFGIC